MNKGLYTKKADSPSQKNLSKSAKKLREALDSLGPRDGIKALIEQGISDIGIPWKQEGEEIFTDYTKLASSLKNKLNTKKENPETETSKEEDSPLMTEVVQLLSELTGRVVSLEAKVRGKEIQKVTKSEDLEDPELIKERAWLKGMMIDFKPYRKYARRN